MPTFVQDIRYALRMFIRNPGFSAVAILTLALGIAATVAIFSVVDAVLLAKLPFKDPDRLVQIFSTMPAKGSQHYSVNGADLNDWRARNHSFEQISAYWPTEFNFTIGSDDPERVHGAAAAVDLFGLIGITPVRGREFTSEEGIIGRGHVAMLSEGFWTRRFGRNADVIGRQIRLQEDSYTIVGILSSGIEVFDKADVWVPQEIGQPQRGARYLNTIGKLKPGITIEQAQTDVQAIARQLEAEYPTSNKGWSTAVIPLSEQLFGETRKPLILLLGAVTLMLLVACSNAANLMLTQAESRQKEFAVRIALGAQRFRLSRQLLIESISLSLIAGVLGLGLGYLAIIVLLRIVPNNIPRLEHVQMNGPVLAFGLVISMLTGALFGLAPLTQVLKTRVDLQSSGSRGASEGVSSGRTRALIAIAEITFAIVLVNCAGLLMKSFSRLLQVNLGFQTENIVAADIGLPYNQYDTPEKITNFYERLTERLASDASIRSIGATTSLPMRKDTDFLMTFTLNDRPVPVNANDLSAYLRVVDPGYFATLRVPLLTGRAFTAAENVDRPGVALINESMLHRYWQHGESPIGKHIKIYLGRFGPLGYTLKGESEIIGVVSDIRQKGASTPALPSIYLPFQQAPFRNMTLIGRTDQNPASIVSTLRREVHALDPSLPLSNVATLEDIFSQSVAQPRFRTILLGLFAALSLLLASIGIYGVTAYNTAQRLREIGIRMAMGAQRSDILRMLAMDGMKLVSVGMLLGTLAALMGGRLLAGLLFGIKTPDLPTLLGVPVLFTAVALAAFFVPALRALKVDPMVTLRNE